MTVSRLQFRITALVSVGVGFGVIAMASGWSCPFAAAGAACPGCGCTRAATTALKDGPLDAFRSQPTASLVLMSALVVAVAQVVVWLKGVPEIRRLRVGAVRAMASVLIVNWLFQLAA